MHTIARRSLRIALLVALLVTAVLAFVVQPFVRPIASEPPPVDSERLRAHVKHLSVDLYPRSYDQLDNTERVAQYILDAFAASGGGIATQDVPVQGVTYRNLIARFGPATGPVIVVGAHYDSHGDVRLGSADPRGYTPDSHTPGADDNASGVAGLLELARLLGEHPPSKRVELVAYALEEPPHFRTAHMGSDWHARALRDGEREVALMLSLEMIGYFTDEPESQQYPAPWMSHLYSDRGDFIALVGRLGDFGATRRVKARMAGATDLPVRSINAPTLVAGIDFSDHLNYWRLGYPAFMVTDTAFLRNANYHRASDTHGTLDYDRMGKVVQAVYAVVQAY
jgi:Zn-dependent M28 family amino/carboxypeptidase